MQVVHFDQKKHDIDIDSMKLERLNKDEEDVARKRIIETQERAIASPPYLNPLVQCAHCVTNVARGSTAELKCHVKLE